MRKFIAALICEATHSRYYTFAVGGYWCTHCGDSFVGRPIIWL